MKNILAGARAFVLGVIATLGSIGGAAGGYYAYLTYRYPDTTTADKIQAFAAVLDGDLKAEQATLAAKSASLSSPTPSGLLAARPQSQPTTIIQSSESSDIKASVLSVGAKGRNIFVNYILQNKAKVRVYVEDARTDQSQTIILGSGGHLDGEFSAGIPFCSSDISNCLANPNNTTLDKFTYSSRVNS